MRRVARLLSYGGCAVAVLLLSKYHATVVADPPYDFTGSFRFTWAIGYIAVLLVATYAVGLPDQTRSRRQALWLAMIASLSATLTTSAVQFALGDALLPRFVVFGAALFLIPWQVAVAGIARDGRDRDEGRDRVLLVAAPAEHVRLESDLLITPERSAALVATLTPEAATGGEPGDLPIVELQRRCGATVVVLDRYAQTEDRVVAQAAKLHESGSGSARCRASTRSGWASCRSPSWSGRRCSSTSARCTGPATAGSSGSSTSRSALVGVLALVVVTPFVVLGNLIANRGPLLYRQTRVGKGGEHFTILKFRTMRELRADGRARPTSGPRRTTRASRRSAACCAAPTSTSCRRWSTSCAATWPSSGPAPSSPATSQELSDKLPFYDLRHLVRPGLTGWAQVKYGYAGDERDALEKLQYEFFYLRHQDLTFDQRIVLRTLRSMVGGRGAGR